MKHTIISTKNKNKKIFVQIPDDYSPVSLPYFKEWTEKLESGKIKQGEGFLCKTKGKCNKYCCLGVLSKIQDRLNKNSNGVFRDGDNKYYLSLYNPFNSVFGIKGDFPEKALVTIKTENHDYCLRRTDLAALNDSGFSFKDISKVIKILWKE